MKNLIKKLKPNKRDIAWVACILSSLYFYTVGIPTAGQYLASYSGIKNIQKPIGLEAKEEVKTYAYNEQVPQDVIEAEIRKQANDFGLDEQFMVNLAFCESTLNNLATNENSTATGIYQYLWGTWKTTESWQTKKIARTDYKANIREAMIDISNGEYFRWEECLK